MPVASDVPQIFRYSPAMVVVFAFVACFMFVAAGVILMLPFLAGGPPAPAGILVLLALTGAAVAGGGIVMTFACVALARTRICVGTDRIDAIVPSGHDRLLVPHFRVIGIATRDVRSVERRSEIVRTFGFAGLRESLSITTSNGDRIGLASAATVGPAPALPLDEIAAAIATAAGTTVTQDATVISRAPGLYGASSSNWNETPLDTASAQRYRTIAIRTAQISSGLLFAVFLLRAFL